MSLIKVLVLGGNGFIGKNILEEFRSYNKYDILAPTRAELNLLDAKDVEKFIKANSVDVIIHSAVNIHSLEENLQIYFNIKRVSHLFKKLITIGSGAEYDLRNYEPLMKEEYFNKNIPADTYGLSKYVVSNDIEESNYNFVNLRVFGIFGKYEDYTRRFISNNICKAQCGSDITLFQNMNFDFIYIKDFLKILEFFIENKSKYKNYNVCSSNPISLLDLANIIHNIHGNSDTKVLVKEEGIKPEYSGDNSRLMNELTNFEFTSFPDSISELYEWYKDVDLEDYCNKLKS